METAEATFTPGPWEVEVREDECEVMTTDKHLQHVAYVGREANARLIAAAPALYAALEALFTATGEALIDAELEARPHAALDIAMNAAREALAGVQA